MTWPLGDLYEISLLKLKNISIFKTKTTRKYYKQNWYYVVVNYAAKTNLWSLNELAL